MGHREALLAGARRCLEERGYARTTARDLVAASGTNLASIGYHFGSKEALLNEAIVAAMADYTEAVRQMAFADPEATPLERIRASWVMLVESFNESRPMLVAFTEALAQVERSPELRRRLADSYEQLRATVAEMVQAAVGELPVGAARPVASFLIASYDGLQVQWLLDPDRAPTPDELWESLGAALPAALAAPPVSPPVQ